MDESGAPPLLELSGAVDVRCAAELRAAAIALARRGTDVRIDCEAVERLDVTALQILLALDAHLRAAGKHLRLTSVPAGLEDQLRAAGADAVLLQGAGRRGESTPWGRGP